MLRRKLVVTGALLIAASAAHAIKIGTLAEQNNLLIELEAEEAVLKKRNAIAELKAKSIELTPAPVRAAYSGKAAQIPVQQSEEFFLRAVYGTPEARKADLQYQGTVIPVSKGEQAFNGWEVQSIDRTSLVLIKKNGKKGPLIKTVRMNLGVATAAGQVGAGRDLPQASGLTPIPVAPPQGRLPSPAAPTPQAAK